MDPSTREALERAISAIARDCPPPHIEEARVERVTLSRVGAAAGEPFGRWLLAQRDRGDWIDRLADAARADRGFPREGTPDQVRERLRQLGADGDAFEQVDDAERDWRCS